MTNQKILNRFQLVNEYMILMSNHDYKLIDLNMIEPFRIEDKRYQPSSLVFERNERMYAIRSDWTRSLLNYNESYFLDEKFFCYFGPIIRDYSSYYQAGVELYEPSDEDILRSIELHLDFAKLKVKSDNQKLRSLVINNDYLIDLYIEKYNLPQEIRPLIYDKNLSGLSDLLGRDNPLNDILSRQVSEQFDLIQNEFSHKKEMILIKKIKAMAEAYQIKFILDLSFSSPQSYYNGLYFQVFLNYATPLLSGGEYNDQAFGIAIDIENGGLL